MKICTFILLTMISFHSCENKKRPLQGETAFQKKLNAEFKDATTSPLKKKDLRHFEGLHFFKVDSSYVVGATIKRTPNSEWFSMKTNTDRVSKERVFGVLHFQLKTKHYQLKVYQGEELMQDNSFEDYLFLPFLDKTNGFETYGGGRYIDLKIPEANTLTIDFNTAYNPYCAYNENYSCPIVPRENYLDTKVEAGVKRFKNH